VKAKLQEFDQPANQPNLAPPTTSVPPRTQSEAYFATPKPAAPSLAHSTVVNEDGGYDLAPIPISGVVNDPGGSNTTNSTLSRNGAEESIRPSSASTPSPSDRSKLGLLPRRPRSLITDNPPPLQTSSGGEVLSEPPNDEDDDLYVPNSEDTQSSEAR